MKLAHIAAFLSAGAVLAGLTGCSADAPSPATPTSNASGAPENCASQEVFCIGMVTDIGKVDDTSFNEIAWKSVQAAARQTQGRVRHIQTADSADWAGNIKQFTDAKYDVVVTAGYLMADATTQAAAGSPDVTFIGLDQPQAKTTENLTGLVFPEDRAGYAAGYLAGLMTKTNELGQVLGLQIPSVERYAKGFENGARAANADVKVTTTYHPAADNAFDDPAWGAATAKQQVAAGADIVFAAGGHTGNGALTEVAKTKGAGTTTFCIGSDADQWTTVPAARPCLVTSATKDISKGLAELITQAKGGSIQGGNFTGDVSLAPYHGLTGKVPQDVQNKVSAVVQGLTDGSIQTGVNVE